MTTVETFMDFFVFSNGCLKEIRISNIRSGLGLVLLLITLKRLTFTRTQLEVNQDLENNMSPSSAYQ
jgi:hypothetical protein